MKILVRMGGGGGHRSLTCLLYAPRLELVLFPASQQVRGDLCALIIVTSSVHASANAYGLRTRSRDHPGSL